MRFYWYVFLCSFFISCQSYDTTHKIILRAEAIMFTSPDSASLLLSSIPHPEKLPKADYAAWCLQYTHAQFKLHKKIKSDSLINIAVDYYKNTDLFKQSGTSYYLLGCIRHKLQLNKQAMMAFKEAEYLLGKTNENKIKGLVAYYIGDISLDDENYHYALQHYQKSLHYFMLSNDKKLEAYTYSEISNMFNQMDYPFDSVMRYSNLALKLSKDAGDSDNYTTILARQGELLYKRDFALSTRNVLIGYRYFPERRPYYAALLSYTYCMLNKPDSAQYYLQISLSDPLITKTKVISYLAGAYIEKNEGHLNKAFEFLENAYNNRDSVLQQSIKSQLYRIDKQYDLSKKEAENATLKIDNRNKLIVIGLLIIGILLVLILFLLISARYKKKHMLQQVELQRVEYSLQIKKAENTQKRELLLSKLENRIANTLQINRMNMGIAQYGKLDEYLREISAQSILLPSDWPYYIHEVDQIFDQRISQLSASTPQLTQPDLMVITLICLKLDIPDCCSLLNMKKNAMYHRRTLIKDRIGINPNVDLEAWVHRLMAIPVAVQPS